MHALKRICPLYQRTDRSHGRMREQPTARGRIYPGMPGHGFSMATEVGRRSWPGPGRRARRTCCRVGEHEGSSLGRGGERAYAKLYVGGFDMPHWRSQIRRGRLRKKKTGVIRSVSARSEFGVRRRS